MLQRVLILNSLVKSKINGNNKYYKPPYTKIKLDLDYRTEKPKYRVYNNVDGKRTEIPLNDFNDTLNHLKYLTKARFIIYLHKIYVNKNSLGNDKKLWCNTSCQMY